MLSTLSILSLDQGHLYPKPQSEDEYFARFGSGLETEPGVRNEVAVAEACDRWNREWRAIGRAGWLARLFG